MPSASEMARLAAEGQEDPPLGRDMKITIEMRGCVVTKIIREQELLHTVSPTGIISVLAANAGSDVLQELHRHDMRLTAEAQNGERY